VYKGGRVTIRRAQRRTSVRHADDHNVQAMDAVEVPDAGCSDAPSSGDGSGRDKPVVRPHVCPCYGQPCPKMAAIAMSTSPAKLAAVSSERWSAPVTLPGAACFQMVTCFTDGTRYRVRASLIYLP
jgi:hypothetical protein